MTAPGGVIDLNADLGEGYPFDAALLTIVTSANVACGFHAGDAATMRHTMALARDAGVTVGAHPSYRDRNGFGRVDIATEPDALARDVAEQVEAALTAAAAVGASVRYVKPHGALYNRVVADAARAAAVVAGIDRVAPGLPVLGLPGSAILAAVGDRGIPEAFADRGYTAEGTLVPRTAPGALVTDPSAVADRVVAIALGLPIRAVDGTDLVVRASSVCLHGDTPDALALGRAIRAGLSEHGVRVASGVG